MIVTFIGGPKDGEYLELENRGGMPTSILVSGFPVKHTGLWVKPVLGRYRYLNFTNYIWEGWDVQDS